MLRTRLHYFHVARTRMEASCPAKWERSVGYAIVHAGGTETNDEVVFAEAGDMILLGARSLEGLNLRVDARSKQLVDAGPIVAAVA